MRTARRLAALLIALALPGCSEPEPKAPPLHPVEGSVTYAGKPAAGVRVTAVPQEGAVPGLPTLPTAETGPDGRFRLTCVADGDGAPEGKYRVVLNWPRIEKDPEGGEGEPGEDRLMDWYDLKHSTLTGAVKPGPNQWPPFALPEVKGPAAAVRGVPGMN